jgi:hypothetical protein
MTADQPLPLDSGRMPVADQIEHFAPQCGSSSAVIPDPSATARIVEEIPWSADNQRVA